MPRIARKKLIGHYFHIMVQGMNKEYIFSKEEDKIFYLKLISKNAKICNVKVIAYCIMNNHAHILVHSDDISNMTKFMQKINTVYGISYNRNKNRVGYVFRNRYNVQEIRDENHLKNCIVYIHKNPVKARMIINEDEYQFSSYNEYIRKGTIISRDFIKFILGENEEEEFIEMIKLLHKKRMINEFIDIETVPNYNKVVKQWKQNGVSNENIITKLRNDYNLSERVIADIMKTTRHQVRNIIK